MQDSLQNSTIPQSLPEEQQLNKFLDILIKSPEERSHKESTKLMNYALTNKSLSELAEKLSPKFVKSILMKYSTAICLGPDCLVAEAGQKIINFYIVLNGRVMTLKKKSKKDNDNDYNQYERLGAIAHSEMRQTNRLKKKRIVREKTGQQSEEHRFQKIKKQFKQQDLQQIDFIGIQDRSLGTKYLADVFTAEKAVLLAIPVSGFLSALAQYLDSKIADLYDLISQYPCFHGFDKQLIQKFIISLEQKKQKRGYFIYRQHESVKSIYLLTSGEVKLTKESNLFVQNPNNLYANRISLMFEKKEEKSKARYQIKQEEMKKAEASLPYADLSLMFNYAPKKKTVQISKLHSFCIFGGEELIQSKKRETNAICNSLEVTYFQIQVSKIEEIFGRNMPNFINGLKAQAKSKVLHRQFNYANTINFENKTNLNYFYFDGEKEHKSHHKHKILKINNKIEQKNIKAQYKSLDDRAAVAPQYTAFNFQKLATLSPIKSQTQPFKRQGTADSSNPETRAEQLEVEDQADEFIQPNKQEIKIMNITHTWKLIKQKVDVEMLKSHKLSPQKYTIDVNDPLIDNKFFTNLESEKRRIERQIRKDKITLGQNRITSHLIAKQIANM